jgi:hypothetical protein
VNIEGVFLSALQVRPSLSVLKFFNNLWGASTSRNRVIVPARQATQPGGIGFLESILGLLKSLKIRALQTEGEGDLSLQPLPLPCEHRFVLSLVKFGGDLIVGYCAAVICDCVV